MIQTRTGTERITAAFARAREQRRAAMVPYICAGDPDLETTAAVLTALGAAGADVIELGIPYGDPLADGPTVAAAAQRALAAGTTVGDAVALTGRMSAELPPILAFTYVNPLVQYGLERFAREFAQAGGAGAIVPDVPLEEAEMLRAAFAPHGLALPQLIAPTTPLERAVRIADASDGFIYLVSRLGVTSAARGPDVAWIARRIGELRSRTSLPLAVGFGISSTEHVRDIAAHADGIVIGSALVDALTRAKRPAEAAGIVREFLVPLAAAARQGDR